MPVGILSFGYTPPPPPDLDAPVLYWTSGTDVSVPNWDFDITEDFASGDAIQLQIQASGGVWSSLTYDLTQTLTQDHIDSKAIEFNSPLGNAAFDARMRWSSGASTSDWSNTVTKTISAAALPAAPTVTYQGVSTDGDVTLRVTFGTAVGQDDVIQVQTQVSGFWFTLFDDTDHTITAGEDTANFADIVLPAYADGSYQARARVNDGTSNSVWSNVVDFTTSGVVLPSYVNTGNADATAQASTSWTVAVPTGAAAANRVVVVAVTHQNAAPTLACTIGGVSATAIPGTNNRVFLFYATVPSGTGNQNVVITNAGAFNVRYMTAWVLRDLTSTTPYDTATGPGLATLDNVLRGDIILSAAWLQGTPLFTTSTVDPDATYTNNSLGNHFLGAQDFSIDANEDAFVVGTSGTSCVLVTAGFR